jgi:hypothetical protein
MDIDEDASVVETGCKLAADNASDGEHDNDSELLAKGLQKVNKRIDALAAREHSLARSLASRATPTRCSKMATP